MYEKVILMRYETMAWTDTLWKTKRTWVDRYFVSSKVLFKPARADRLRVLRNFADETTRTHSHQLRSRWQQHCTNPHYADRRKSTKRKSSGDEWRLAWILLRTRLLFQTFPQCSCICWASRRLSVGQRIHGTQRQWPQILSPSLSVNAVSYLACCLLFACNNMDEARRYIWRWIGD